MDANIDELNQDLYNIFNAKNAFKKFKGKDLYIILVNGKRVTLKTGRNVWSGIGGAKIAMRYHLNYLFWSFRKVNKKEYQVSDESGKATYLSFLKVIKESEDEWISKHVVYIPLSIYSVAALKINKTKELK